LFLVCAFEVDTVAQEAAGEIVAMGRTSNLRIERRIIYF